jgi:hypothetical protein
MFEKYLHQAYVAFKVSVRIFASSFGALGYQFSL